MAQHAGTLDDKPSIRKELPAAASSGQLTRTTGRRTLLTYALIVFAVGALGGLYLASCVLRGQLAPWPVSLLHAGLGAIGLLLVIYAALTAGIPRAASIALIILVVAALGGFYLASIHLRGSLAPRPVVFVHAGVAVIGFLTLLGAVVGTF